MKKNKSRGLSWSIIFSVALFAAFSFVLLSADGANAASTIGTNILTTGTLEVQNTASAAYLLTGNAIQVGGHVSVAYSRFGTTATTEAHYISTTNDVLVNGDLEVDGSASFAGPASVSGSE